MSVEDTWHYEIEYDAQQAGVTEQCEHATKRRPLWPKTRHGRGTKPYRVRNRLNGRELPVISFEKKGDAEDYDALINADRVKGVPQRFDTTKGNVLLVDYGREVLRKHYQDEPNSLRTQLGRFNNHVAEYEFFEKATMRDDDIQPSTVTAWLEWLRTKEKHGGGKLDPNTVESVWVVLNLVMKIAIEVDEIRQTNPLPRRLRPTRDKRKVTRGQVWEQEEVAAMLQALPDFDHSMGELAATCGHRQGELFAVAVEDFAVMERNIVRRVRDEITIQHQVGRDADNNLILKPPKWNSVGTVPLDPHVANGLRTHIGKHGTTPMRCTCCRGQVWHLLFAPGGTLLDAHTWNAGVWWPAFDKAEISPRGRRGVHGLRHFFGSMLIDGGADPKLVQALMRHKNYQMTMDVYGHLFKHSDDRARNIISTFFAPQPTTEAAAVGETPGCPPGPRGTRQDHEPSE